MPTTAPPPRGSKKLRRRAGPVSGDRTPHMREVLERQRVGIQRLRGVWADNPVKDPVAWVRSMRDEA